MNTTIIKTVFIQAVPETVWAFLTDKDKLGEWYHPAEANLAPGAAYSLTERNDPERKRIIWGRVLEADPPKRLVTTFNIGPFNGAETTVTWELSSVAGGTRLLLSHEGVAEASGEAAMHMLMALDEGWEKHLGDLRQAIAV